MSKRDNRSTFSGMDWGKPGPKEHAALSRALNELPQGAFRVLISTTPLGFRFVYMDMLLDSVTYEGSAVFCRLLGLAGDVLSLPDVEDVYDLVFGFRDADLKRIYRALAKAVVFSPENVLRTIISGGIE